MFRGLSLLFFAPLASSWGLKSAAPPLRHSSVTVCHAALAVKLLSVLQSSYPAYIEHSLHCPSVDFTQWLPLLPLVASPCIFIKERRESFLALVRDLVLLESRKISKIIFGLFSWGQGSNVERLKQQTFDICVLVELGFLCHFK